eukprot:COSAG06_NODE_12141_length_1419_cov_0.771212_1_plen_26_part_10
MIVATLGDTSSCSAYMPYVRGFKVVT